MRVISVAAFSLLTVSASAQVRPKAPDPAPAAAPASAPVWHSDFEAARQLAKTAKLHLLLAFTTAEAAGLSAKLETEVLATPEFLAEAAKGFLLVRVDLPADESQLSPALRKQNTWLRSRYPSSRLPAVWLCEPYARAYATSGYLPGGSKVFLAWMEERRQAGIAAHDALMRAGPLRGIERAKVLAEGLQGLDDAILSSNFNKELMEVIQIDADGAAGLKAPFDAIARDAAARPLLVRLQAELQPLREQQLWDDLEKLVAERLAAAQDQRSIAQYLTFLSGCCRLEGRQDATGALTLFESALAMAKRSELAPEIARLHKDAAAAVEAQKARDEAARKAEEAKKKPGKKK
ncbi:MAG: hypothetical protein Q7T30_00410 [Planctomycetota bacterium]|nr:hypothetical protein [Planctomycetota bacterium]